ncbi:hypothetical protein QBC39DRAFT_71549 [Podospora conica]|nr:hypothetical protein QBC39DRAFT_71549 [Schizothecium conicum]
MPVINGKKMACIPCIRGHRSTGCAHGKDRVLIEVRKPGRPLANCPCQPGKACTCGAMKIAIPKNQKCGGCPPEQPAPDSREPSPLRSSRSPTANLFRVAKTAPSSKRNGRKQSFHPSNLDRVDLSTVGRTGPGAIDPYTNSLGMSMAMAPSAVAPVQPPNLAGYGVGAGVGVPGMALSPPFYPGASNINLMTLAPYPMLTPPQQYPLPSRHSRSLSVGHHYPAEMVGLGMPSLPSPVTSSNPTPTPGNCCGEGGNGVSHIMGTPHAQYSEPMATPTFTYPAEYGSWNQPIDPHIWQQMASGHLPSMTAHPMPAASTATMPNQLGYQCTCGPGCQCVGCAVHPFNDQTYQYVYSALPEASGINGGSTPSSPGTNVINGVNGNDGARLNGSPASNDPAPGNCCGGQTQPTSPPSVKPAAESPEVRASSVVSGFADFEQKPSKFEYPTNGVNGVNGVNGSDGIHGSAWVNGHTEINGNQAHGSPDNNDAKPGSCCGGGATAAQSSPEARVPSVSPVLGEAEQTVSDLDYLWVTMPPRQEDGCYGLMLTCPCGDDCSCVGCILHNP